MLGNIADPEGETDGADRVGEGQAGLAIPSCGVWGAGCVQQITGPQGDEAVEAEQRRRCSRDCLVGPLPLGFDAEMRAGLCEGDLDLPTSNEECDDVGGRVVGVSAEEGLGFALALGASDVPGHGFETARCAGYAAILTSLAASGSRAFCMALI